MANTFYSKQDIALIFLFFDARCFFHSRKIPNVILLANFTFEVIITLAAWLDPLLKIFVFMKIRLWMAPHRSRFSYLVSVHSVDELLALAGVSSFDEEILVDGFGSEIPLVEDFGSDEESPCIWLTDIRNFCILMVSET